MSDENPAFPLFCNFSDREMRERSQIVFHCFRKGSFETARKARKTVDEIWSCHDCARQYAGRTVRDMDRA